MSETVLDRVGVPAGIASIVCGVVALGTYGLMTTLVHGEGDWMTAISLILLQGGAIVLGALLGVLALIPRRSRWLGLLGSAMAGIHGGILLAIQAGWLRR